MEKPRYKMRFGTGTVMHDCSRCCFRNAGCHEVNRKVKCNRNSRTDSRDIYFVGVK